jgi:hypothetical protein
MVADTSRELAEPQQQEMGGMNGHRSAAGCVEHRNIRRPGYRSRGIPAAEQQLTNSCAGRDNARRASAVAASRQYPHLLLTEVTFGRQVEMPPARGS